MISAFGVDHGYEIEKAFGMGAIGGTLRRLGAGIGVAGRQGAQRFGQSAGRNIAAGRQRTARAQIGMGRGLKRVGQFGIQRPGLTGGLAAGGAAAGVGAGAGALSNRRRY